VTPAIRVEHLSKRYHLGPSYHTDSIREAIANRVGRTLRSLRGTKARGPAPEPGPRHHQALDDVGFEIRPGEAVGIIGRNGAGKSTLLKVLSRVTEPDRGRAELCGRVGSLLEVGTGFHPELSGRDNIFLNGAILGMSRREITARFAEIVEFAEIGEFLDTPVKRYSSGMYVRLAFAVAAHLSPEILLIDEVLAVGDLSFQRKCLGKMNDLAGGGRTIVFVSHNMAAIRGLTQSCLYLVQGRLVAHDSTARVIDRYLADAWRVADGDGSTPPDLDGYRRDRVAESPVAIERIAIDGRSGREARWLAIGEDFTVRLGIHSERAAPQSFISFWLSNQLGERVVTLSPLDQGWEPPLAAGSQTICCRVKGLPLSPGRYTITAWVSPAPSLRPYDVICDYPAFEVDMTEVESGEMDRTGRPWGAVHWNLADWSIGEADAE
jgi:lipopolysaccharide transport system ATP-binding protein